VRFLLWTAPVGVVLLATAPALAIDRDSCAIPYQEAQVLRKKRIFLAAQEQLELCKAQCPAVLAADCSQWAAELKALTPTVFFHVHDAGGHVVPTFHVAVDGTVLNVAGQADSSAAGDAPVPVDPGAHVFRVDAPGFTPTEVRATLNEGEHGRAVDVSMVPLARTAPEPVVPPSSVAEPHAPSRALALTFGVAGVVGLVTGGALSIAGFVERANLRATCAPNCQESRVLAIQTTWWVGAASGAVGAASLAVGVLLWPRGSGAANATQAGWWAPVIGIGRVGVEGGF
jgi:hypothetical protein